MARAVDVDDVVSAARVAADMVDAEAWDDDTELIPLLNVYYAELRDLLIESFGPQWFADSFTISTVAGTSAYTWPAPSEGGSTDGLDFYLLLGVDVLVDGEQTTARPYTFAERNDWSTTLRGTPTHYHVHGGDIELRPVPDAVYTVTVHFVPCAPVLESGDSLDGVNGWERYIVVSLAIEMLRREESDTTSLEREKAALAARIRGLSPNRDAGSPAKLSRTRRRVRVWGWR